MELARERGLDAEGALWVVRWKGSFRSVQPETISLPLKTPFLTSFDGDTGLCYDFYSAKIATLERKFEIVNAVVNLLDPTAEVSAACDY